MQKVKQHVKGHKHWPEDGFYCSACVGAANEAAQEYKSRIVTGPTLRQELRRREEPFGEY